MKELNAVVEAAFERHFNHATPGTPLWQWAQGAKKEILNGIDNIINKDKKREKVNDSITV